MLDWISGAKPDHPLADPKRARELIAGLPSFDPPKALDEIREWLESVSQTQGFRFEDRLGLVKLLDESGQQYQRKILRDYLATPRPQKFQENRMWNAAASFWRELAGSYARSMEEVRKGARPASRGLLSLLACRGIRAAAQQLKWMQLRYGPIDPAAWVAASGFFRIATELKLEREVVELYAGTAGSTTAERELLKLLMLWATPLDTLSPELLDLAERLTAHFAAHFVLEAKVGGQTTHCYDPADPRAPRRVSAAGDSWEGGPGLLFIGAGGAPGQIAAMRKTLAKGMVPEELGLGTAYPAAAVDEVLAHLGDYWSATPPGRRHNRLKVQTRLAVLHGFDRLLEELCGDGSLNFEGVESWLIEDISASGFGAVIPGGRPEWVRIGSLIGTQPEGVSRWGVGIVRRVKRTAENQGYVGVETLAMEVLPVRLRPVGMAGAGAGDGTGGDEVTGLRLGDGGVAQGEVLLILPGGMFSPRESLDMVRQGRNYLLIPVQIRERGDHYEIGSFREMLRE